MAQAAATLSTGLINAPTVASTDPVRCIAVAACAYLHSRHCSRLALAGLWILSVLLVDSAVISALTIGVFLAVPTLLTLTAAVAASVS